MTKKVTASPCMIVYKAVDDVPANRQFLVQLFTQFVTEEEGQEPKTRLEFQHVHFAAGTPEKACEAAEAWWGKYQAKEEQRKATYLAAQKKSPRAAETTDAS